MKTLYIHIGTPKTGTTALQQFCQKNTVLLEQQGYCYPETPVLYPYVAKARNGHFLAGVVKDETGKRHKETEAKYFQQGMSMVIEKFLDFEKIILSDESIWRAMDAEFRSIWTNLQKEALQHDFQIKVIVYLRRQDKLISSHWNQSIKKPPMLSELRLDEYMQQYNTDIWLNYSKKLDKIAETIGKENIIVRRFDKNSFFGGNIYSDFMEALGIPWTEAFKLPDGVRNPSLSGNAVEIKRILNGIPESRNPAAQNFLLKILLDCSAISDSKHYPSEMFSKEETLELLEKYQEGNQKIAKDYLGEENLFECELQNYEKWIPDNAYMMEDVIRFTGISNLYLREENEKLRAELMMLEDKVRHPFRTLGRRIRNKLFPNSTVSQ